MKTVQLLAFVFLISSVACDKKEDVSVRVSSQEQSVESGRVTESASRTRSLDSESVAKASPQPERQICVPTIQGMSPQQVPWELRVYCDTKQPLNPQAYQGYMQRVQAAAAEAQQEIAARQQAMQATGDSRLAGIQQQ